MSTFGRWSGFPFTIGGTPSPKQAEYNNLRAALAPDGRGFNVDSDLIDIENEAHATALRMVWDVNRRTSNQAIPLKMLEEVTRWEEILRLRPDPSDSDNARRAAIDAKTRGFGGNNISDIEAVSRAVFGPNFIAVNTVEPDSVVAYDPGTSPGPPGREWSTNRLQLGIVVSNNGLSDAQFASKRQTLHETLDAMFPAWMTFFIGTAPAGATSGFICDVSICDIALV